MHRSAFAMIVTATLSVALVAPSSPATGAFIGGGSGSAIPNESNPRSGSLIELAVSRDGATATSDYLGITLYALTGNEPCDTYVLCETADPDNFLCTTGQLDATDASAVDLAALLADTLTSACPSGTSASSVGAVVNVKSGAGGIRACVFSKEMGLVDNFALGLNVGAFDSDCAAHNVSDGVGGNERSTVARTGGFSFTRPTAVSEPISVPALPGGWKWLLAAIVTAVGTRRALRTTRDPCRRSP